jgi:amino acid permease
MTFAFVCHDGVMPVFQSLRSKTVETWATVSAVSFSLSLFMSTLFAVCGYLTFFGQTKGDILVNFGTGKLTNIARCVVGIAIIFTYPIVFYCLRSFTLSVISRLMDPMERRTGAWIVWRWIVLSVDHVNTYAMALLLCCVLP